MENEMKFCQSCGMPLSDEMLGTRADGNKCEDPKWKTGRMIIRNWVKTFEKIHKP